MNNLDNILVNFRHKCLNENLFLSENYQRYLSVHKGKEYKIKEYQIQQSGIPIYFMFTLVSKAISYFDFPIEIHVGKKLEFDAKLKIIKKFLKLQKNLVKNYTFSIGLSKNELENKTLKKINPKLITEQQIIDLNKTEDEIFKNFKSNLRYEINKTKKNIDIKTKIIDKNNYSKNFILEMMETHVNVSGRQTRSKETWLINEQMIMENQGFLSLVYYKSKAVSYSLFFYNHNTIYYFSSVTLREYFKLSGISHLSLWEAIKFAKQKNIKNFNLGLTGYFYSREDCDITPKEKNIAFFKSRFSGIKKYKVIIDQKSNIRIDKD